MPLPDKIISKEQQIARLESSLAREKIKKRKADTRRKIEFGGLIIKAEMGDFPKDVILGALVKAKETLEREEGAYTLFESTGKKAFLEI